jgi:hypothetical protein
MTSRVVTTQVELNKAAADKVDRIEIRSPAGVVIEVSAYDSSTVIDRIRQNDASGCAECEDEPRWTFVDKLGLVLLIGMGVFGFWLVGWLP